MELVSSLSKNSRGWFYAGPSASCRATLLSCVAESGGRWFGMFSLDLVLDDDGSVGSDLWVSKQCCLPACCSNLLMGQLCWKLAGDTKTASGVVGCLMQRCVPGT